MTAADRSSLASSRGSAPAGVRRADIQGLRAVAVAMVVAFHAGLPVAGGFAGVDVFFVISGFVITAMLSREWEATGRIDLRRFYLRRYMRLTPALAGVIVFVLVASLVLMSPFGPERSVAQTGIGALLFTANLVVAREAGDYFASTAARNPLLNTWSLSVEEQFYLVLPAALIGGLTLGRTLRRVWLVPTLLLAITSVASLACAVTWVEGGRFASALTESFGGPEVFAFYALPARVWEFGVGCLFAIAVARGFRTTAALREASGWLGLGLLVLAASALGERASFPGWLATVPVAGTTLLLVAGTGGGSRVSDWLSAPALVAIGDASYSLYLWHWPLIVLAEAILPGDGRVPIAAAVVSLLPAWISHHRIEQPLRALPLRTVFAGAGVVLVTSGLPILLASGLAIRAGSTFDPAQSAAVVGAAEPGRSAQASGFAEADRGSQSTPRRNARAWRSAHAVVAAGCVNGNVDPVRCRFGPRDAAGTILLVGDSQAYAIADGLIAAAVGLGHAVVASSQTGCPFLARGSSGSAQKDCPVWQRQTLAWALRHRPAAIVLANRSAGYVRPERGWLTLVDDRGRRARSVEQAAALWRIGLEGVIAPLREAGIPVVLVASVAEMPTWADQRSLFAQTFGGRAIGVPLAEVVEDRRPAFEVERAVLATHPAAVHFDPLPWLCDSTCASERDGVLRYQDATHLSLDGSLLLEAGLREALRRVLEAEPASRRL